MTNSLPAEIAVIIVNYGTAALAAAAVESVLARSHGGRSVEVHLVDNASPGEDAAFLAAAHRDRDWDARVTLYPETVNHGFGRGNNLVLRALAARAVPPRYVFLLNPDARLKTEALDQLAGFLDAHPDVAIAGCAIERPDDGPAATAAFRFPGMISEFTSALNVGAVERPLRRWSVPLPPDLPQQPVDWVSGAAFMARFAALAGVDHFRPEFFLYFEEVDMMRRIRQQGWQIFYVPQARVIHVAGAATGVSARTARKRRPAYWYESWRIHFLASHGRLGALGCALARMSGWSLNYLLSRIRRRPPESPERFLSDFSRHVIGPLLWPRPEGARHA